MNKLDNEKNYKEKSKILFLKLPKVVKYLK